MHACTAITLDQLLSVRDAEPCEAYVVQHVNTCAACSRELERLCAVKAALQTLPQLCAPPFESYTSRRQRKTTAQHRSIRAAGVGALAASVAALALVVVFSNDRHHTRETPKHIDAALTSDTFGPNSLQADVPVTSLVLRSQGLESRLRQLPNRPYVERASTTTTIDSLQSRIQWVDYQLSVASDVGLSERQAAQLWQDRIQLMDSLVKVRYAEAYRFAVLQ